MPTFVYTAKDSAGQTKVDRLEADSETDLVAKLKEQGLYLVNAQPLGEAIVQEAKKEFSFNSLTAWRPVSRVEKMMAVRNLAVMIGAGLSLTRALEALAEQATTKKFKEILVNINDSVSKGVSFSDSLAKYPKQFNELFVSMVRAGEASGTLQETLIVLYRQMKKDQELRSRIRGALIYPSVILAAMVIVGSLMLIYVVPSLAQTFADLDVELPLSTRTVIWVGTNMSRFWPLFLGGIIGLAVGLRFLIKRTVAGRKFYDTIMLDMPLIGPIVKKINNARFARTLSSLIEAGLPIVRALEITSDTLVNHFYNESVSRAAQTLQKGGQLSSVIRQYPKLYQPMVVQMIAIGEETGAIASLLKRIALFFEGEVANITKNLSSVIEPILMIVIGAVVGFFAISMFQPIYSLVGAM